MGDLYLRVYPDPVLRKKTAPVEDFGDSFKELVADLARLMRNHDGVGLAAPQAGIPLKLAVVWYGEQLHVLANPVLVSSSGEQEGEEGCLSFPNIFGNVRRPMKAAVRHRDFNGDERVTEAEGFLARAFLHEMDHLEGRLLIDNFSPLKRSMAKKKMLKAAENSGGGRL